MCTILVLVDAVCAFVQKIQVTTLTGMNFSMYKIAETIATGDFTDIDAAVTYLINNMGTDFSAKAVC